MKYTHDPIGFEDWCEERWPGRLAMMKGIARANVRPHDGYDELCGSLRAAIGLRGEP
jgi:hypothetical protein